MDIETRNVDKLAASEKARTQLLGLEKLESRVPQKRVQHSHHNYSQEFTHVPV